MPSPPPKKKYIYISFKIEWLSDHSAVFLQESRLKELDEEHNLLQDGLQVIERARKWYFKRITAIQEEKLHLQNEDQYSLEQVATITLELSLSVFLILIFIHDW